MCIYIYGERETTNSFMGLKPLKPIISGSTKAPVRPKLVSCVRCARTPVHAARRWSPHFPVEMAHQMENLDIVGYSMGT